MLMAPRSTFGDDHSNLSIKKDYQRKKKKVHLIAIIAVYETSVIMWRLTLFLPINSPLKLLVKRL
jgi:hypothetical protein